MSTSPRAVRMALLRYHRYGLLHREWRHGQYQYRLSDRGARRILWLKGLAVDKTVGVSSEPVSGLDGSGASE